MAENANDQQSLSRFLDFINKGLDLSRLDAPRRLTDDEIETRIMPLIRADIASETLSVLDDLMQVPEHDHWRTRLAPLHREVRDCLAPTVGAILAQRYPNHLSANEWSDAAAWLITVAWLVRKQIDGDDLPPSEN